MIATGAACQQRTAYSYWHLVLSHLGLAFVLMLRLFFPELVMSTDLLSFEHPSVLLFCFKGKSRKYQGVFEVKSRVKTWQVRGIWSQSY